LADFGSKFPREISQTDRDVAIPETDVNSMMDCIELGTLLEQGAEGVAEWNRRHVTGQRGINLCDADFGGVDLTGIELAGAALLRIDLASAKLSRANLGGADLSRADLSGADLSGADLFGSTLFGANLFGAKLTGANLSGSNLFGANLRSADLSESNLVATNLTGADLTRSKVDNAICGQTCFAQINLSETAGLANVRHLSPSTIGIETLIKFKGQIPESFLRGCGLPEQWIEYIPSMLGMLDPIQFYSCFISYSAKDETFAERLHADLQAKGVRCWFAPEDLKIGAKLRVALDESIRLHEKLLLILSKHSVASAWVEKEVETAMERERQEDRIVLFPIRLDDAVMDITTGWPADIKRTRNIGDFKRWKDHDAYTKTFDRLLRDLNSSAASTKP
jgi:uncharacterized protein YjbI with pentapeptide repeats